MAIVARAATIALAALVAVAACEPAPSPTPASSGAAGTQGPSPAATQVAVQSPVACTSNGLPEEVPLTPADAWDDRVFYEIFVRSFQDSDGDGIGDLAGLTSKLDYLNDGDDTTRDDLGVTGIWLMPVAKSPSYHGYDVTDYTAIEPDYGTEADFRAFIEAAHERGIKVIVDFVINHTSVDHPWFKDALAGGKHHDWYIWSTGDPHWPAVAGPNPWHQAGGTDQFYYGAFWEGMPDLNLANPEVTAEIERIAGVWLDDFGVDGFRIDAAKHLIEDDGDHQTNTQATLDWLEGFKDFVHADRPDALVLGEVYDIATLAGRYVPDSLDMTFDFGLAGAFKTALQTGRAAPIGTALAETLTKWPAGRQAPFLTNHDQDRIMSSLNSDLPSARLAAGMLLTSPGVPFIYYGEEIGMRGRKPDERIRTPMQWSAEGPAAGFSTATPWERLSDDWETVNVAAQSGDPTSLLSTYRDAIRFNPANDAIEGETFAVDGGADSVIGWVRATAHGATLVVVNVAPTAVTEYGLTLAAGPLCGFTQAKLVGQLNDSGAIAAGEPLAITDRGGLDAAKPLAELAPRGGYVFQLTR
jgi:glycosidase